MIIYTDNATIPPTTEPITLSLTPRLTNLYPIYPPIIDTPIGSNFIAIAVI